VAEVADGQVVDGRYRITGRIGSGGMADVYCAEDAHLGREVAIKILHRRFSRDLEFVERFKREASAAAGLQHPNVVNVFDRGEHDGTYYIAMENLHGRTLKDVVREDAPLPQERVIDMGIQVLEAAGFAHERGIVHRDLKPHNAIVADDDSLKVTDFGIARAGASEMTETGSIMGTAQYISPEQAQGQRVGPASDIYSVGVMLYEMLTGHVPFEGDSAVAIALKHVSEAPPAISSVRPDIHPALEAAVIRALVKEPERRYGSAAEFVAALGSARAALGSGENGQDTANFAPPIPIFAEDEPEPEGRRRWPWIASAALLLALAGLGAWLLWGAGGDTVEVPNVVGQQEQAARVALERQGFDVAVERRENRAPAGRVFDQDPDAGRGAEEGSEVKLLVSSGPGTVRIPDVERIPEEQAVDELNDNGLKVDLDEEPSTRVPAGQATRTSPKAGTIVERGSRVRLFISAGPQQVEVPGVVGETQGSARAALTNAGLEVEVDEQESDQPEGRVIAQTPQGGTTVNAGSTVTITVSKGRELVSVPSVTGRSTSSARAALEAAGFRVGVVRVESEDRVGEVIRQRPGGGSRRPRGTTVTIFVGREPEDPAPDEEPPPGEEPGTPEGATGP
jgi:eukaryotic-like serine/threonine-protein kinase